MMISQFQYKQEASANEDPRVTPFGRGQMWRREGTNVNAPGFFGVQQMTPHRLQEFRLHNLPVFHYRRTTFFSQIKSKVGNILAKDAALRITLT
jgi:hypothetical protein